MNLSVASLDFACVNGLGSWGGRVSSDTRVGDLEVLERAWSVALLSHSIWVPHKAGLATERFDAQQSVGVSALHGDMYIQHMVAARVTLGLCLKASC